MAGQLSAAELRAQILAEVDAERQRLDEADRQVHAEIDAVLTANQAAQDQYDEAVRQAVAEHRSGPGQVQLQSIDSQRDALYRIRQAKSALLPTRRVALAEAAGQVEDEWQAARAGLDARARKLADQAERLAGEYREWWRLVREVRESVERRNPNLIVVNGLSTRMRPEPDTAAVVTAAANGVDLCAAFLVHSRVEPVTGRAEMG
jgi:chromosome segregation ATPase